MLIAFSFERTIEKGLVVPGKFTAFTNSVAIGKKIKRENAHKELCKHMDIELTESDLTEMKLFSFTLADSTVVKTEKLKIRWQ